MPIIQTISSAKRRYTMFCYQCEQTAKGEGCAKSGVCGKLPDVAALQDLLVYVMMGLGQAATAARKAGIKDHEADVFTCEAMFATLTNVDFDPARFLILIHRAAALRDGLLAEAPRGGRLHQFPGRGGHAQTGGRSPGADPPGRGGRHPLLPRRRSGHPLPQAYAPVRAQGDGGLCGPRTDPREGGRGDLRLPPRGARRDPR